MLEKVSIDNDFIVELSSIEDMSETEINSSQVVAAGTTTATFTLMTMVPGTEETATTAISILGDP